MWSWSKHQTDRAISASFTAWRQTEPEPTITDPDYRAEAAASEPGEPVGTDGGTIRTGDEACDMPGAPDCSEVSEQSLSGMFETLARMLEPSHSGR
ncbi:hypothetical protein [Nocardia sp. NBC_00511]|uniref:hypothetical protein n=1 Tax=Nocardia sp. NBC_00511 TaxID=2903591 RepID=UPI0030E4BB6B